MRPVNSRIGQEISRLTQHHPELSGIYTLSDGLDAFAARMKLADLAEQTLDLQYYIWNKDMSGMLMYSVIQRAADRGVKVRLLLDDNNTRGLDNILLALDRHPNIEVRLFNAFKTRKIRALSYLTDFSRLNRRMHNKGFTADNQATIIGGRNIGDEYFSAGGEQLFSDLDVLAIGPVVSQVSEDFERYWNCPSVNLLTEVIRPRPWRGRKNTISSMMGQVSLNPHAERYVKRLEQADFFVQLAGGKLPLIWAKTHLISDDPAKARGEAPDNGLITSHIISAINEPMHQLDIISPYFVPTRAGVEQLIALAEKGVDIAILTNSLKANDVAIVHAGYAKWRRRLLQHGIKLYELKRDTSDGRQPRDRGLTGKSGSSLHAKTFSVDCREVFVGSFNFDPRSAMLNTEMGFVIASESLSDTIHQIFIGTLNEKAYQVCLDEKGKMYWREYAEGRERIHQSEPGTLIYERLFIRALYHLPIEWLL
ncbi:phospholipase D family protein [Biostraticola tofi]|uniref:Putative cardiolipin synthase n=1 Tax=Biostraticola tofi TaxID=466109 RepID=A0A4R3YYD2_9GAMM|nr:phospholipase D family protein [Biostraticola tofi]TCV98225.1 putative cardiolipin synthase [Biostraticola tofi]